MMQKIITWKKERDKEWKTDIDKERQKEKNIKNSEN